jgi:hypothetical protein
MRNALLLFGILLLSAIPASSTSYFIAPAGGGGSDSNNGTSSGTPWLTPNHAVNCGDTITAAASTSYVASNFGSGKWGTVTCSGNNNVVWLQCATFDACKISSSSGDGVRISANYWGVQGFEVTTASTGGACFSAIPPNSSTSIHHIIFANNVANGCQQNGFDTFNNGSASADYIVIIGNIAYNAAQNGSNCYSGISIYQPQNADTASGTHIYVAGNFSYSNVDGLCNAGVPTDGEGIIFDTFDGSQGGLAQYTQQAVAYNNMLLGNGGRGFEVFNNSSGGSNATIYSEFNTTWGNNTDTHQNATFCGEMLISFAKNVTYSNNLSQTKTGTGCGANPIYVFYIGDGNGTDTVATNYGYSAAGNNCGINSSTGFSCGTNTFGTNPSFSSPSTPGAPSCGSATSVPNCMATVISNFTASASGASAYGYQAVSNTTRVDPLYPAWLCTVTIPLNLVTPGCGAPSGPPTISPLNPVLTPSGSTQTFTVTSNPGTGGHWTCANAANGGTCLGSINSGTGVYTPPTTLAAPQSIGGYPLLPWDHVYNMNVSSLPVCDGITHCSQSSATFIAGAGTYAVNFLPDMGLNYVTASTPTNAMNFYYTPGNNASYPDPGWPSVNIQSGWFDALSANGNADHHEIDIGTDTGNVWERYQYYAQAPITNCTANGSGTATATITPTRTSSGFVRDAQQGGYVTIGSFTGADTWCNLNPVQLTSATANTLTFPLVHAAASTSTTGQVTAGSSSSGDSAAPGIAGTNNSQSGITYAYNSYALPAISTNAAGTQIAPLVLHGAEVDRACATGGSINHALQMTLQNGYMHNAFLWPATTSTNAGSGVNFYGQRFILNPSYNISGFSACAQILLTQMKNYGLIVVDGGYGWQIGVDYGNMGQTASNAMQEINLALIPTSNWEAIDESSLEETASSGATTTGEVVTYTASTGSASTNVALMGTAVDVPESQYYFAAGAAQTQLLAYSNGAVAWSSPQSAGTILPQNLVATATVASSTTIATTQAVKSLTGDFVDITVGSTVATTNPTSVGDICGNSYTHEASADFTVPGGGGAVSRWYGIGITGCSSNIWTATYASGQPYESIVVREYNPNGATITLDVVPTPVTSSATGQTSITTGAFTTTGTNEVAVAAIYNLQGYAITPGAIAGQTATNFLQPTAGGFNGVGVEDALFTSTETGITASASFPAQNGAGISVMTYKGSGGTSVRGTLTSGGLFTPPASLTAPVTATMLVTSSVNSSVVKQVLVHIFPLTDIRMVQSTANFIDSHGYLWVGGFGLGASNAPSYQGCCQNQIFSPSFTDFQLFNNHYASSQTQNDYKMDIYVPNGTYTVTYNLGTANSVGANANYIYVQGTNEGAFDPSAIVGVNQPYTYTQSSVSVPSGVLSFYLSGIGQQTANAGDISSFAATQTERQQYPSAPPKVGLLVQ